jgi:alpha-N-arabinofuranosidase
VNASIVRKPLPISLFVCAVLPLPAQTQFRVVRPMPAVTAVYVDAARPGGSIPAALFGAFLEPIGNSINGGLSAQLLVNPSLESGLWDPANQQRLLADEPALAHLDFIRGLPLPWLPWDSKAGNRYETHAGSAANSYQSVELLGTPGHSVGLMQRIYLPAREPRRYIATAFAKSLSGNTRLTFAIRRSDGTPLAHSAVAVTSPEWTRLTTILDLDPSTVTPLQKVEFGLYLEGNARVEVDEITLTPSDAIDGFDPDVLALARHMGMTELRFGGNYSSLYHWRDGVGDPDKRLSLLNVAWGIPEYNDFGTDEFLTLCRDLHVTPQINLNMGSGTAEEAAAWAAYIRSRYRGPVIWELGNELWGPWQLGAPAVEEVAALTLAYSKAVHSDSTGDRIIATGGTPTAFTDWNAAEFSLPVGTFDDLSLHFVETNGRDSVWKPKDIASTYMVYAESFHVGAALAALAHDLGTTQHSGRVHFAMTEWLFNSMSEGEGNFTNDFPAWNNLGGAVAAGGFLNTLLRHTDQVDLADMTGMIEFAGIAKRRGRVYAQPAFYAFEMYSAAKEQMVLPVRTDTGSYAITDPHYLFANSGEVPFVDAVATQSRDGSQVTVFLVNRSLQETALQLDMGGWTGQRLHITQLSGNGTFDQNTAEQPEQIVPRESSLPTGTALTLPGQSVTRIDLQREAATHSSAHIQSP